MGGSDHKCVSSSTPIKPFSTPNPKLLVSGTDENEQSYHKMSINFQNSKKPTKQFMSPTISSASKAIAPTKKILAERNENTDTHFQKSPNVSISEDSDSLSFGDDSSLKPHDDSLTNYPSPRPKFLRYKPNGRREIILRYEKEIKERKERADLVGVSQEGEAVEERDEEIEEEEEGEEMESGGVLRRFLEFVLVLLVLVLSTIYISSMNSPTFSPTLQTLEELKDGCYLKIQDRVNETMKSFMGEDDHYLKVMEFKKIVKFFGVGGIEFMDGNIGLMMSNQTVFDKGFEEVEMVEDVYLGKVEEMSYNLGEVAELQGGASDDFGEMVELQVGKNTEYDVHDLELEKSGEDFDQMLEILELKATEENVEKLESFDAFQQENKEVVMEPALQVKDVAAEGLEMEKSENVPHNLITNFETQSSEADTDLKEGLVEQIETDIMYKAFISVALFSAVVVSLALALHLKRKKNIGKDSKESSPIIMPCSRKSEKMEKCSSEIPTLTEENVKCVDSFSSPMSLVSNHSNQEQGVKESSISLYESRGPSIELLGEFEVVQVSSSLRSCGMKSKMAESEVSSHSVSFNKAHSVPLHAQPCVSEFSAMNSFSYGNLITPEKKILKKEDGKDAEAKKVVVTPVRRSSRIRNRAITSP